MKRNNLLRTVSIGSILAAVSVSAVSLVWGVPPAVRFRWPLLQQDWQHLFHYVDLDPATPGVQDWNCAASSYDTHRGTDIQIRDFVEMDEGRFIVAVAPGTVLWVEDSYFDRSAFPGNTGPNNFIHIRHDDGSEALYLHFKRWSSLVSGGQRVFEGQPLALVGSSGNSSDPHVHLEIQDAAGIAYDPFAGPCRAGSSYWNFPQPAHITTNPVKAYDVGLALAVPDILMIKERYPDVTHVQQVGSVPHYLWHKLSDIHAGDVVRVIYRTPAGAIYSDNSHTYSAAAPFDWLWWQTFLPATGSLGSWKVQLYLNGMLELEKPFVLDAAPYAAPVVVGRTVPVSRGVARGRLNASDADSGIKRFSISAPAAHGEVVLDGPHANRFHYVPESGYSGSDSFQVVAEDAEGRVSAPATMTLSVSPTLANSLRLEGEEDYVSVPANASLNVSGPFTIEAWVKPTIGSNKWSKLIDRRNPSDLANHGVTLVVRPDQLVIFEIGTGSARWYLYSTTPLPLDRWTHIAAVWDGSWQRLYFNGIESNYQFFAGPVSWSGVGELRIGGSFEPFDSFRGNIDEVRWWSVARSASELQQGASCSFYAAPPPSTLRGNWRFGGNANDSSTFANHGARVAGASFVTTDAGVPLRCTGQNLDADPQTDANDNCPLVANAAQTDSDLDGVGDACDLCASTRDRAQFDSDGDGVGDACDRCPFLGDSEQPDADGDGAGDGCDPFASDATRGVPSAAITLSLTHDRLTGTTTINWSAEARSSRYELYRGSRAQVEARFYGVCQNGRDPNPNDRLFAESESPAVGSAFFYLVLGVGADGTRGLAGLDSGGRARDLRARDCR